MKLFAPEGSAEGCASGECLPESLQGPTGARATPAAGSAGAPGANRPPSATVAVAQAHLTGASTADPTGAGRPPASLTPPTGGSASPAPSGTPTAARGPTTGHAPPGSPSAPGAGAAPSSAPSATADGPGDRASGDTTHAFAAQASAAPPPADEEDEPSTPSASAGNSEHDRWRRAVDAVRAALPRHGKSLSYARFLGFSPDGVRIAFPPDAAFHRTQVIGMSRPLVEAELTKSLGRPGKLVEEAFDAQAFAAAPKSIAEVEANDRATREKQIEARVRAHPAVRSVLKHLGGSIEHIQYLEPVTQDAPVAPPDDADPPGSD
ncbi:MAG: hypothetical protein AB1938_25195 [Myxococcota bacterium]